MVANMVRTCDDGDMTEHRTTTGPDFPHIHADLIARGIPCHIVSDGHGEWTGVVIGYRVHPVITVAWVDGAYEITFPCGMCAATMRMTGATPGAVAEEMAQQYRYQDSKRDSNGGK